MSLAPSILALTFLAAGLSVTAQTPRQPSARLTGTVTSSFNGKPLPGVMIAVPAARQFAVTDSTGEFHLGDLPSGRQKVRIAYQGRETEEHEFALRAGKSTRLAVVLDVEAMDLAPLVVEARHRDGWRDLAGFYERRKWYGGFARFYTHEDLERWHPATLSQLLMRDGIFTYCGRGGCVPVRWSRGGDCFVAVAVDGVPFRERDYDAIPIDDVRAVEVYRSAYLPPGWVQLEVFTTPRSRRGGDPQGVCGSVHVWTR